MAPGPEGDLIRSMEGAWRVQQRVWPDAGATPITSGPYDAERRLIGNAFLQETMTVAPGSAEPPFTRTAYLAFNNANRRYEYVSLDTRYPRIMYETSFDGRTRDGGRTLEVFIDNFTHPGWGAELTGQAVRQRREIRVESPDRTVVRQYWTPPAGAEFLAIEYVYTRQR